MISHFNMSLNGLRFAHLAGEKEIQSRLLLMGMESVANCHELKLDLESEQVSLNLHFLHVTIQNIVSTPKYASMSMAVFWHPKQFRIGKKMETHVQWIEPKQICSLKVTDSQLASVSRVHCIFELLSWKLTNAQSEQRSIGLIFLLKPIFRVVTNTRYMSLVRLKYSP